MKKLRTIHKYKIIYLILLSLIFMFLNYFNLFLPVKNTLYDVLLVLRHVISPRQVEEVVLVLIDDYSLQKLGQEWPISRDYYSQAIEILQKQGVKGIGLDIIFSDSTRGKQGQNLVKAFAKYDNIVLPVVADISLKRGLHNEKIKVTNFNKPIPQYAEKVKLAHINFIPDRDGIIRELPLNLQNTNQKYSAFSLKLAKIYGLQSQDIPKENLLLNYSGPTGSISRLSFSDLLNKNFKKGFFNNKIVLIGVNIQGLGDQYMTPFSRYGYFPGVELHGQALYNILNKNFKKSVPFFWYLIILVIIGLIYSIIFTCYTPTTSKYFTLITLFIFGIIGLYLFYNKNIYIDFVTPMILVTLLFSFSLLEWYLFSEKERRYLTNTFSNYLPSNLIDKLMVSPELANLGGERREVSIIFIDIRDFTTFANTREPEVIVKHLNHSFTEINQIIFEYNGTLDKYLGDGVMAFFGAPVPLSDHPRKAVKVAKKIQKLKYIKKIPFEFGIGINTGTVVVGNIGSSQRMDYTIVGNAVNKTARFVDIAHPGEIIIGIDTFNKLPDSLKEDNWIKDQKSLKGCSEEVEFFRLKN